MKPSPGGPDLCTVSPVCPVCGDRLVPPAPACDPRCVVCRAMGSWHPPEPRRPVVVARDRRVGRDVAAAAARAVASAGVRLIPSGIPGAVGRRADAA